MVYYICEKHLNMRHLLSALFVSIYCFGFSQSNCKPYVPVTKGTKWEVTSYSPKDKATGTISYELLDVVISDNKSVFSIRSATFDKKGEQSFTNEFEATCVDGKFEFDMSFMMDGEAMQAYKDMDVDVDASEFEIPTMDAVPGTILKDGILTVKVGSAGMTIFKMVVNVTDRKVEAKEEITTPAGSFHCLNLTQNIHTKMGFVKVDGTSKEWYAENIGVVRSESYNKKGKLTGYDLLTKLDVK